MLGSFKQSALYQELNARLVFIGCFVSLGAMGFGFDNSWWGGALGLDQFNKKYGAYDPSTGGYSLPSEKQSAGTGTGSAGIILGCLAAPWLCSNLGRKPTLLVMSGLLAVGTVLEASAITSFWQLVVGRIVVYSGIGVASNVVPMYQSECAPTKVRGAFLTAYSIWNTFGGFMGTLVVFLCQNIKSEWAYLTVILCQLFVPVGIVLGYAFLPETPRYLVYRGRLEEAEASMKVLFGPDYNAKEEIHLLQLQLEEQREFHKATSLLDCFRGVNLRRTVIAMGTQILQQAQGISFINNFIVTFMEQLGFPDPLKSNVIVQTCGLVANLISLYTFDKLGRRINMLVGALLMAAMMMGVGGASAHGTDNLSLMTQNGCVAMLILWYVFYGLSWGPGVWILSGEIGTGQLRERTLLLASLGSFVTSVPINFVNPYVQAAIGGRVTFIYGSFSVAAIAFVYFLLPETKDRSLEELDEMFQNRVPTKEFSTYVCTGLGAQITQLENKDDHGDMKVKQVEHVEAAL
ncbi:sugar transporter [Aspergillus arachidicola]|uniref:Sugar transporter n=1 Tax=Aspergillus arachidicola TaxID=656916 RepID=A0A2G7FP26_9EURO|nr:sugar transporter [Aspergillus arachidicola]